MSIALPAQTFTSLYSFAQQGGHGWLPEGGVVVGPQGQLYGTTYYGGTYGYGTIFELAPPASQGGAWTETVLHSFSDQGGDAYPITGVSMGPGGALYGVAQTVSGSGLPFFGAAFQLRPPSGTSTHWPESILYQFTGGTGGGDPEGPLTVGPGQAIYGTTFSGGGAAIYGTVFRLTPPATSGGEWTETVLWGFGGGAGQPSSPQGTLAVYGDRIYGATKNGGISGAGAVFELTPPTVEGGSWTETTIYNFSGENGDGSTPAAGVVVDANGVLYGTTELGGEKPCGHNGCGIVFSLTPPSAPGGTWTETILHTFTGANGDGFEPLAGVILGPNGVLYGTTDQGGSGYGIAYELVPPPAAGGTWTEVVLHSFDGTDGSGLYAGLAMGTDGTLYGTAGYGGASNQGTVFSLVP
ncbi:MAG: choice-of-anchor tandem repeat GloVer-containing protein [Bryobacteraceae bacterium]|jgi:uncharacterized repeat protein (TIGR03803 family)